MRDVGPYFDQAQLLPTLITKVSLFKKELRDVGPARYDQVRCFGGHYKKVIIRSWMMVCVEVKGG